VTHHRHKRPELVDPTPRPEAWSHPAALETELLLRDCVVARGRSSGPGGQHRNKVETQITITHEPTGLVGQAGERREGHVNHHKAVFRLRLALATEIRTGVPRGEIGSPLWKSRLVPKRDHEGTVRNHVACNPEHDDYPSLLAEALDVIDAANYEVRTAAIRLETTASQLLKLIANHPPALERLNQERAKRNRRPLKPR
jgi:hypothetical protein